MPVFIYIAEEIVTALKWVICSNIRVRFFAVLVGFFEVKGSVSELPLY